MKHRLLWPLVAICVLVSAPSLAAQKGKVSARRAEPLQCQEMCGEVCHLDESCFGWSCYWDNSDLAGIECLATVSSCHLEHDCVAIISVYTEGGVWLADRTKCDEGEGLEQRFSGGEGPTDATTSLG